MKPITIVGGGLAGLTLGIMLRQRAVPVTIVEATGYPRHRVCGEFISGAGVEAFNDLKLDGLLKGAMRPATHSAFFTANQMLIKRRLPKPAITVSRFNLDAALAENFCKLGGELRTGDRWLASSFDEGIVCATGRRAQPVENGWRWFGLKIHARRIELEADLEMHIARDSYVGLCQLANGEVNICGLFRRKAAQSAVGNSINWLRGEIDSLLFRRLEGVEFDAKSFCAVAGLSLRRQTFDPRECRIGDALTMIPPITGNGMSIAFESARLALDSITDYAEGRVDWRKAKADIAKALKHRFRGRLRWAALLHHGLFSRISPLALRPLFHSEVGWRAAFAVTR